MSSPKRLTYDLLDVFTTDGVPFTGNALAVIYGAESLSQKQLQTIARGESSSLVLCPGHIADLTTLSRIQPLRGHLSNRPGSRRGGRLPRPDLHH